MSKPLNHTGEWFDLSHEHADSAFRILMEYNPDAKLLCFHPSEQRAFDHAEKLGLTPHPDPLCPLGQFHLFAEPPDAEDYL